MRVRPGPLAGTGPPGPAVEQTVPGRRRGWKAGSPGQRDRVWERASAGAATFGCRDPETLELERAVCGTVPSGRGADGS